MTTLTDLAELEYKILGFSPPSRERTLFGTAMGSFISKRKQDIDRETFVAEGIAAYQTSPEDGMRYAEAVEDYLTEHGIETLSKGSTLP